MEQKRSVFMGGTGGPHPAPLRGVELRGQLWLIPLPPGPPAQRSGQGKRAAPCLFPLGNSSRPAWAFVRHPSRKEGQAGDYKGNGASA